MSDLCQLTPISAFMSTNLSSKIECFKALGERILRNLGHPMINVEIHPDQLYDAISQSCEFFTKYAGYTKEYLIFDSRLYDKNKGIRLDHLFTVANTGFTLSEKLSEPSIPGADTNIEIRGNLYISLSAIPKSYFTTASSLSSAVPDDGITQMQILEESSYKEIINFDPSLTGLFMISPQKPFMIQCEPQPNTTEFNNMFDYDIMDYRKVIDVTDFEEGSNGGVNSLFSLESTLAQQTYFSYAMGSYGFDLLSWHTVKDWQDTREKLLATRRDIHFDNRTQYLKLIPQPRDTVFHGLLTAYIERPLRDIIKEVWVQKYATALAKVMWGRVLTHISGVVLLGGGTYDGATILQEGITERNELEELLYMGGYGDVSPPLMLVS